MPFLLTSSLHLCDFPLFRGLLPSCRGWVLQAGQSEGLVPLLAALASWRVENAL